MKDTSKLTEPQLHAELARVKAIKEWLWVGIIICILALASLPLIAFQSGGSVTRYEVGAMQSGTFSMKMTGEIGFSDSLVYLSLEGRRAEYKVSNRANGNIYVTDGTMTHTMFINPWPG